MIYLISALLGAGIGSAFFGGAGIIPVMILALSAMVWAKKSNKEEKHVIQTLPPLSPILAAPPPIVEEPPRFIFNPSTDILKTIKALVYLGKADGQLMEKEVNVIIDFLTTKQPEHNQTPELFLTEKIRELKTYSPEQYHEFTAGLTKDLLLEFKDLMLNVFRTQNKNHPYEDILIKDLQILVEKDNKIIQERL